MHRRQPEPPFPNVNAVLLIAAARDLISENVKKINFILNSQSGRTRRRLTRTRAYFTATFPEKRKKCEKKKKRCNKALHSFAFGTSALRDCAARRVNIHDPDDAKCCTMQRNKYKVRGMLKKTRSREKRRRTKKKKEQEKSAKTTVNVTHIGFVIFFFLKHSTAPGSR